MLNILDSISFYKNQAGSCSFRVGYEGSNDVILTDDGVINAQEMTLFDTGTSLHTWGEIHSDKNIYAPNIQSDIRLKENIKDSEVNAIERIKQIEIKSFDWKDKSRGHIETGFIAQQVEKIDKTYVLKEEVKNEQKEKIDENYYINELPIMATMIKAIQEQQEEIEQLKEEIKLLKGDK